VANGQPDATVEVELTFEGTDKAAAGMEKVAGATDEVSQSLANVTAEELKAADKMRRLERQTARLQSQLAKNTGGLQKNLFALRAKRAAEEAAATGVEKLAAAEAKAALAIELESVAAVEGTAANAALGASAAGATTTFGTMTSAAGSLLTVVGVLIPEAGIAAGAVGALGAASSATATAMGAIAPVLIGLTVALPIVISLFREEASAAEDSEEANKRLTRSYEELLESIQTTNRARTQEQTLAMGLGTINEQQARLQEAEERHSNLEGEISDLQARRTNARTDLGFAELAAELEGISGDISVRRLQRDRADEDIRAAREGLRLAREEQAADITEGLEADLAAREERSTRSRGGSRGGARAERDDQQARIDAINRLNTAEEQHLALLREEKELRGEILRKTEEQARLEAAKTLEVAERNEERRLKDLADRESEAMRRLEELEKEGEERRAEMARTSAMVDEEGKQIAGVFSKAFALAIRGQEDFGVALQAGFSELLLRKGEEAVFDGSVALLQAVGFFATGNVPAGVGKTTEGLGLIALGATAGAVGAAIAPSSGGGAERPREEPADQDLSGSTTIINFDSPVVTAQTNTELAQSLQTTMNRGFGRQFGTI